MSFTQGEHLFAGVHELGVNEILKAFFTARPRYLNYGTPPFVLATTAMATAIQAIQIQVSSTPPVITKFEFKLTFTPTPTVDITPGATPALMPGVGEFVIKTGVTFSNITVTINPFPPFTPTIAPLDVIALCEPVVINSPPGTGNIGINLKKVVTVPSVPLIDPLIFGFLTAALANVHFPFNTVTVGAFGLILLVGPLAETDQFKVRGNAL